jgi:hypothetical protein
VIGMTPASGGEVDELLEPVWSWPERTMPANAIGEGMPRQPSRAAISDREDHGATPQPQPNPSAVLTVRA